MKKKRIRVLLPKTTRSYADYDYLEQLNARELEFLRDFTNKFYRSQFNREEESSDWPAEEKRKAYSANNARQRDIYTRSVDTVGHSLEEILGDEVED